VLFEMLSGQRAFPGGSQAAVIAAILSAEPPPVSSLRPGISPALDHLVAKCLEKDPDERWQSAADVAEELRWLSRDMGALRVSAPPAQRPRLLPIAAAAAAAAGFAAAWLMKPSPRESQTIRFSVTAPVGVEPTGEVENHNLALSPDGARLAYVGQA